MKEAERPYFFDRTLPHRVQKYMDTYKIVNVHDMTEELMDTYKEYRNKSKKTFMKSVSKAYKWQLTLNQKEAAENRKASNNDSDDVQEVEVEEEIEEILQKKLHRPEPPYSNSSPMTNGVNAIRKKRETEFKNPKKRKKNPEESTEPIAVSSKKRKRKFESSVPETSLENVKGINGLCTDIYLMSLNLTEDKLNATAPRSVLLLGPKGSGKTMLAQGLAGDLKATLMRVQVPDLTGGVGAEGEVMAKELFNEALSLSPCILLLENLDCLSSKDYSFSKGVDRKVVDHIQSILTELETNHKDEQILVIAESRSPQSIDVNLRTKFKSELFMPVLHKESRLEIIKNLCTNMKTEADLEEISVRTTSFVGGDLKELVEKAQRIAWERLVKENLGGNLFKEPKVSQFIASYSVFCEGRTLEVESGDFLAALPMVIPTLKKEGFPSIPDTTWEDVGGLEDIKEELSEKILVPMKYGELHEKFRAKKPNGILLWGPPGCGKTLLAKAVANHAGVNLYAVMGPELLNMYQGESERAIREVFKRAGSVAPCVIFFDEFDCICPRRSVSAESGSKMTIVNTLLVEMNGFNQRKDVYVMAATNRPDMVDPAVLRPGRFDTSLFVGLPDAKGRIAVLNACTRNGKEPKLASDVDLNEIGSWCDNFSGADCAQLVYMASKNAITEEIEQGTVSSQDGKVGTLYKRHFVAASKRVSPSVAPEEQKKYMRMKTKFESWKKTGKEIVLQEDDPPPAQ